MKKVILSLLFLAHFVCGRAQKTDSLIVHYYENFPYAYTENGTLKGIEVDILQEYVVWLKTKKSTNVVVSYKPYKEFGQFYNSVKDCNAKCVGLGSVTH